LPQVTPQGDGYFCEFDGKTYERMERRYVLLVKASDATGEAYLNMFNEQVKCLPLTLATRS
jgi:Replication factor-A C terminal domain